jgi:hypothetical protein
MIVGTTVSQVPRVSVEFALPAAVAATLVVAALLVAGRAVRGRRAVVAGGCLLGTGTVCAQLALVAVDPASEGVVLAGVFGGSCWYGVAVRLLSERPTGAARQWLGVGSAVWVAGTVSVTASTVPGEWPLRWSLLFGGVVLVAAALAWRTGRWHRPLSVFGGTLVAPGVLGLLAGENVLFVTYLIAAVVAVICWSLVRLALGG